MKLHLPYGEHGIDAEVPDTATVLLPERTPPLLNPSAAVREAIASPIAGLPLASIARAGQRATIVVSDVTRPVPNAVILPPVLQTPEAAGIAAGDITILMSWMALRLWCNC